jgi:hypothetical protein
MSIPDLTFLAPLQLQIESYKQKYQKLNFTRHVWTFCRMLIIMSLSYDNVALKNDGC